MKPRRRRKLRRARIAEQEERARRGQERRAARQARVQRAQPEPYVPEPYVAPKRERTTRPGETRPKSKDKDLDALIQLAWEAGWRVERGGDEHIKVWPPDPKGRIISVPQTPSRQRTLGRMRSAFRSAGLDL